MKVTISYLPGERPNADAVLSAIRQLLPDARIKTTKKPESDYFHTYLSAKDLQKSM